MTSNSAVRVLAASVALAAATFASPIVAQQAKPYTEGSVWTVSMIRVKPGMMDVYMRDVLPMRKQMNEEAKKQGLLVSSHILTGPSTGRDDFDVMFLDEYKNCAAFDGISAKYDAIMGKVIGPEEKQVQIMVKRTDMREILGDKMMQEIIPK